jgi:hypothetical protein
LVDALLGPFLDCQRRVLHQLLDIERLTNVFTRFDLRMEAGFESVGYARGHDVDDAIDLDAFDLEAANLLFELGLDAKFQTAGFLLKRRLQLSDGVRYRAGADAPGVERARHTLQAVDDFVHLRLRPGGAASPVSHGLAMR